MNRRTQADRDVDALYAGMRTRHGGANPLANGYVTASYFRREQAVLFSLLNPDSAVLVDVGCGSGLMVLPLLSSRACVIGVDFNEQACRDANRNGLPVIRGDAFQLPFRDHSVDEVVCCQFFNQQKPAAVRQFVAETARVLRSGGTAVFVWRNGDALVHRCALWALNAYDRLAGRPLFPQETHSLETLSAYAVAHGLVVSDVYVSFPPLRWLSKQIRSPLALAIGASNICVLKKISDGSAAQ